MEEIFSRKGSTLTVGGVEGTIPTDISALSILATNGFISGGDYRNDGYVYVDNKPVREWFKNIDDVKIWFPILEDVKKLQRRYKVVRERYHQYWIKVNKSAFEAVVKVKKAHAKITHKFKGDCAPWWLYKGDERGISFDWVEEPKEPLNLEIGNEYYRTTQRMEQLGGRSYRFKKVLMRAIKEKAYEIEGSCGDLLQIKVLDNVYWFQHTNYSWDLITEDGNFKTVEL